MNTIFLRNSKLKFHPNPSVVKIYCCYLKLRSRILAISRIEVTIPQVPGGISVDYKGVFQPYPLSCSYITLAIYLKILENKEHSNGTV